MDLRAHIRAVPDFPIPGILFRDITPLLSDPAAFGFAISQLVVRYQDQQIDKIVGVESRGFLFGTPLAMELGVGFVPVRKPGKLPAESISRSYSLEYGEATLELHTDAISVGDRVLVIDDLLATGGTAKAACELVEELGGEVVEAAFIIELDGLGGRKALESRACHAMLVYGDD